MVTVKPWTEVPKTLPSMRREQAASTDAVRTFPGKQSNVEEMAPGVACLVYDAKRRSSRDSLCPGSRGKDYSPQQALFHKRSEDVQDRPGPLLSIGRIRRFVLHHRQLSSSQSL